MLCPLMKGTGSCGTCTDPRLHRNVTKLFEVYCEINRSILLDGCKRKKSSALGTIADTYPSDFYDENTLHLIQMYALPCEFENENVILYSFVLTGEDSKWRFGFCRHNGETDTVAVILSLLPWHDTFFQMLKIFANLKSKDLPEFNAFIACCYKARVPCPGNHVKIPYQCGRKGLIVSNPSLYELPSVPENHNLSTLLSYASTETIIKLMSSLYNERRVIIISCHLDRHSACVQALNALLYPMQWQHTFLPVLPTELKYYLSATMPYFIGVHSSIMNSIACEDTEDAVIFNCDTQICESQYNDDEKIPRPIFYELNIKLREPLDGDHISRSFLNVMVRLVGGYRDGIIYYESEPIFDKNIFLNARNKKKREFLCSFVETTMFTYFINSRLCVMRNNQVDWDIFELEAALHAQRYCCKCSRRHCIFCKYFSCKCTLCDETRRTISEKDEIALPQQSLQYQLKAALYLTEYIRKMFENIKKSSSCSKMHTHEDMREIFNKLKYSFATASAIFQNQQINCYETMRNLGYIEICNNDAVEICPPKKPICNVPKVTYCDKEEIIEQIYKAA